MSILEEWSNAATVIVAIEEENKRLRAQRDQLLAALQALVNEQRDWESPTIDRARDAIAAAER